jgi:hypothetical protein
MSSTANREHKTAEIRIRPERKTGELLKSTKKSGDRQSSGQPQKVSSRDTTILPSPKKLIDLDISKDQSSKWQKLAEIPEKKFNEAARASFVALHKWELGCGLGVLLCGDQRRL